MQFASKNYYKQSIKLGSLRTAYTSEINSVALFVLGDFKNPIVTKLDRFYNKFTQFSRRGRRCRSLRVQRARKPPSLTNRMAKAAFKSDEYLSFVYQIYRLNFEYLSFVSQIYRLNFEYLSFSCSSLAAHWYEIMNIQMSTTL